MGDLSPKMMVLGLVVQQADTASGVARRLADQFASARFSKTAAYDNMPILGREGFLRLVEKGERPAHDLYEVTPEGVERFRAWVRRSIMPPMVRDALQGKLEFLELEGAGELVLLVREVRELEQAHRLAGEAAHVRLIQEQKTAQRVRARGRTPGARERLRSIQTKDEVALWETMVDRLERLREDLEGLLDDLLAGDGAARRGVGRV